MNLLNFSDALGKINNSNLEPKKSSEIKKDIKKLISNDFCIENTIINDILISNSNILYDSIKQSWMTDNQLDPKVIKILNDNDFQDLFITHNNNLTLFNEAILFALILDGELLMFSKEIYNAQYQKLKSKLRYANLNETFTEGTAAFNTNVIISPNRVSIYYYKISDFKVKGQYIIFDSEPVFVDNQEFDITPAYVSRLYRTGFSLINNIRPFLNYANDLMYYLGIDLENNTNHVVFNNFISNQGDQSLQIKENQDKWANRELRNKFTNDILNPNPYSSDIPPLINVNSILQLPQLISGFKENINLIKMFSNQLVNSSDGKTNKQSAEVIILNQRFTSDLKQRISVQERAWTHMISVINAYLGINTPENFKIDFGFTDPLTSILETINSATANRNGM